MRIAHISDLHIFSFKTINPLRFLGKRLTGGINLAVRRRKTHDSQAVRTALRQILEEDKVDHIVVTGDLSNLALSSEFEKSSEMLRSCCPDTSKISVIPGNHDDYTWNSGRVRRFESFFKPWMKSDLPELCADGVYPYVKLLSDDVALVCVNTSLPTPPFWATGTVGEAQRAALQAILRHPTLQDRFVLVALHHHLLPPLFTKSTRKEHMRRLTDGPEVLEILKASPARLVIHGHTHQFGFHSVPHATEERHIRICEAGSTSTVQFKEDHYGGKYALYDLSPPKEDGQTTTLVRITTRLYEPSTGIFRTWHERTLTPSSDHVLGPREFTS